MIYKSFHDLKISQLGMGNMRLPTIGDTGVVDEEKARSVIEFAYENGINYFDTAYRYVGGQSEPFVGKVLNQYPRDTWYLATKMPGHMMQEGWTPAKVFEDQLSRCGVDYFDFYLLHNLCETSMDTYMDEELGIVEYLLEQKKKGRIHYLGFSAHGRPDTLERFLEWKDCFDFAQIQLNYMDWILQDAKTKYEILVKHNLPVIVMEPCRGGRLAVLNDEDTAMLKKARPDDSIASWAFRYLKSLPAVQVVLSGMNTTEQAKDNIKTFSDHTPITKEELALLDKVVESLVKLVPCTACEYCCEGCPQKLNIPSLIKLYNEMSFDFSPGLTFAVRAIEPEGLPSNCILCGKCSKACPQGIDIPDIMKKLVAKIDSIPPLPSAQPKAK